MEQTPSNTLPAIRAAAKQKRSTLRISLHSITWQNKNIFLHWSRTHPIPEDLATMEYLPGNLYNFHPGSHVKQGTEIGIQLIAQGLNRILRPDQHTTVLLETMAGKGSEVGRTFEELRAILDRVELTDKMGVCLDTCHVFDAGYDIVDHLESVLEEFDKVIGLGRLRAIHLNDSLNPLGSHKDRHAKSGQGHIGLPALTKIINHPVLCTLPFELETPNDLNGYAEEIRLLEEVFQGG